VHDTDRREEAVRRVRQSGGSAWFVTAEEIREGEAMLLELGIQTSPEGAAVLAAIRKAAPGLQGKRVLGILSGSTVFSPEAPSSGAAVIESYLELKRWAETHIGSPQKR
jgi:hypothetical protein